MFYISFSSASNVNMSMYFWLGFELFRKKIYFSSDVIGLWQIVVYGNQRLVASWRKKLDVVLKRRDLKIISCKSHVSTSNRLCFVKVASVQQAILSNIDSVRHGSKGVL